MSNTEREASVLDDFSYTDLNLVYDIRDFYVFDNVRFNMLINNIYDAKYESNGYFFT